MAHRTRAHARLAGRWAVGAAVALSVLPAGGAAAEEPAPPALTLVTLTGPGTSGTGTGTGTPADRAALLARQDRLLGAMGGVEPVYRWTTALNGFAAALTTEQVELLGRDPDVALVETNEVRPLASGAPGTATDAGVEDLVSTVPRMRGGAGVVVGVVDSGIEPDSAVLAAVPGLGRSPREFVGACEAGEEWTPDTCNRKLVGARWFVAGFGTDRVRSSETFSPQDALGHGTQVASVAVGNAEVTVRVDGRDAGQFGGVAPQARVAAYKACWGAPDPAQDGCATADLVTAIDQAVADRVDVLSLAVAGGEGIDTVERALLGAAEDDVVVVAAAGNAGGHSYAAHASPWVTTVGSSVGRLARGTVRVAGGPVLTGGGRPLDVTGPLVRAVDARAEGVRAEDARVCRPGSLDARSVAGRVVVCARGGLGRVDKSDAVDRADGVGMVLVNVRPGAVTADFHAVPTVHLALREGRRLTRWLRTHPGARVRMERLAGAPWERRTPRWSAAGDPRGYVVKPDVVADADGVLGALPDASGDGWGLFSGSSAATARAAGLAALLRARNPRWSAPLVRSTLVTTARPLAGSSVLHQGTGTLAGDVPRTHLALTQDRDDWRRALRAGRLSDLNSTSVVLGPGVRSAARRVTNVGPRAEYFSVRARGFSRHRVRVRPLAARLAPGESARFTVTVSGRRGPARLDDGYVEWRGARGGVTRVPVAITR